MATQPGVSRADLRGHRTRWAWAVATFLGVGYLAPGPGTYGSVAAVLLWYFAARALHPTSLALTLATAGATVLVIAIGIPAATIVARQSSREDPGFVVIDEVAGQLTALILTPASGIHAWQHAVLALLLFRVFDISKPPPIRRLESLPDGTGIMLDDVAAGLVSLILGVIVSGLAHRLR